MKMSSLNSNMCAVHVVKEVFSLKLDYESIWKMLSLPRNQKPDHVVLASLSWLRGGSQELVRSARQFLL